MEVKFSLAITPILGLQCHMILHKAFKYADLLLN